MVFGGGGSVLRNTFEETFGVSKNIVVWNKIGINPFNWNCLKDNKVKHEIVILEDVTIDVDSDKLTENILNIKRENTVPAWANFSDQDTSLFPRSGSPVQFRNFESLRKFRKGELQWSGPSAVADSRATE